MSAEDTEFTVRRVVVALECSCANLPALERAAEMAGRVKASLHAMFIEDARLLEAAALPFTRQISFAPGVSGPLEPANVEAEFRALAARARRRLEHLAEQLNLASTFEIVRGDRAAALAAATGGDLLVVETATRVFGRQLRIPTDWFAAAAASGRACLLLGPAENRRHNVLVIHDGTPAGDRAMAAAQALGGVDHAQLHVARLPGAPDETSLRRRFQVVPGRTTFRQMAAMDAAELRRAIARSECGLVIAPAGLIAAHAAELGEFLAAPSCALLLVA